VNSRSHLRPLERCVLRLVDEGVDEQEICRRFKRGPRFVHQVIELTEVPRQADGRSDTQVLRPLERRVLQWRQQGAGYDELAPRFRRSPEFLEQVEALAVYKLGGASPA
jgi:hypothetical protein